MLVITSLRFLGYLRDVYAVHYQKAVTRFSSKEVTDHLGCENSALIYNRKLFKGGALAQENFQQHLMS